MKTLGIMKRLKGAVVSGALWGAGWFAGSFLLFQVLRALGVLSDGLIWADGLMVAARVGTIGGLVGAAFSLFIGVWYRGRRLSEISWQRFALTGGLLAGVYVPAFLLTMNALSGDGFPIRDMLSDALLAGVLGTVMAGGSMMLAQRADARHGESSLGESSLGESSLGESSLGGSSTRGQLTGEDAAWSSGSGQASTSPREVQSAPVRRTH